MILEFLKFLFSYQMMPYTVPLFVMLLYWVFFVCGVVGDADSPADAAADSALDAAADSALDAAADSALDAAADSALDAAADSALDAAADSALDAAADSALDAAADSALDAAADSALDAAADAASDNIAGSIVNSISGLDSAGVMATADAVTEKTAQARPALYSNKRPRNLLGKVLEYLHVGDIPATIIFSLLTIINWLFGYLGLIWLRHEGFALNFPWTEGILRFVCTSTLTILVSGLICKPIGKIFGLETVHANEHLIGLKCKIKSSVVTDNFGEGELTIDGSYIIISIRTNNKSGHLWHEGDLAVIKGYDEEKNVYLI